MHFGLLSILPFFISTVASSVVDQTHGVPPALLSRYVPDGKRWTCLDGSKDISWTSVNDDYCDCPDGSDEPGTGACPNTTFHCTNKGHIGSIISGTRVRDGLCEPECCDGSDEPSGVCPNKCKEVGEAYRTKREAEHKLRKTGSKIRASYISFAQKEKKRLEGTIADLEKDMAAREEETSRLKDIVDRTEALSAEALEAKKQSPLYASLISHSNALKSLQREHKKHLEREKALGDILDTLRRGYNPNYQDMAVLEAVRGWEYLEKLPHINDVSRDESGKSEESEEEEEEELEEGMWTADELDTKLDPLLRTDYVSLLLEHDNHVGIPTAESLIYDPAVYIPDALIPQYETLRDAALSWLRTLGVVKGPSSTSSSDASKSKEALSESERGLMKVKKELDDSKQDLEWLFDASAFGTEGEWKKLDHVCLSKDTGDYTYEVCLFDEARQKPNRGGTTFSLGKFASWDPSAAVGTPEYYSRQVYKSGTKCWNGPQRNLKLHLTCGTENALLTVQELEKCEYQFTATTPALCLPLNVDESMKHNEL